MKKVREVQRGKVINGYKNIENNLIGECVLMKGVMVMMPVSSVLDQ